MHEILILRGFLSRSLTFIFILLFRKTEIKFIAIACQKMIIFRIIFFYAATALLPCTNSAIFRAYFMFIAIYFFFVFKDGNILKTCRYIIFNFMLNKITIYYYTVLLHCASTGSLRDLFFFILVGFLFHSLGESCELTFHISWVVPVIHMHCILQY